MPQTEDRFLAISGLTLHEVQWLPDKPPRAALVVVHGVNEHIGRYSDMAQALNRRGLSVYGFDLRGHGRSDGARVWIESFEEYVDDLAAYLDHVCSDHANCPVFLFGHSLGGLIVLRLAATRSCQAHGLIVSAAPVQVGNGVYPSLCHLAAFGSRWFPWLRLAKLGFSKMSRDPKVIKQFKYDPLVYHGRIPTRTGAETLRVAGELQETMAQVTLPLLVLQGTADVVVDSKGSRQLHERAGSTDKSLRMYEGLYHDLPREPEKEQIFDDVADWIEARASSAL